jgi:hypothetical protein
MSLLGIYVIIVNGILGSGRHSSPRGPLHEWSPTAREEYHVQEFPGRARDAAIA